MESRPELNVFDLVTRRSPKLEGERSVGPAARNAAPPQIPCPRLDGTVDRLEVAPLLERDPYPLPARRLRENYNETHFGYWASGFRDAALSIEMLRAAAPGSSLNRVLDFGCSSGRILRHFALQHGVAEAWGCDILEDAIDWAADHLPSSLYVFQNHAIPHLPLAPDTFDAITAYSVFTYIDVFEEAWLLELLRILRPGGLLLASVHTERTWIRMREQPRRIERVLRMRCVRGGAPQVKPDRFEAAMSEDRVVFESLNPGAYDRLTFQSVDRYVRRWGRFAEIVETYDAPFGYQDVIILRKS